MNVIENKSNKKKVQLFWSAIFSIYLFILLFVGRFEAMTFSINKILSPLFVLIITLVFFKQIYHLPMEMAYFAAFVAWCATGIVVYMIPQFFWQQYFRIIGVFFLTLIVVLIVSRFGEIKYPLLAIFLVAMAFRFHSFLTGSVLGLENSSEAIRERGLIGNANGFGFIMFTGIISIFYFWRTSKMFSKTMIIIGMIPLSTGILLSASRKSFMTLLLFFALWLWFCARKMLLRNKYYFILSVLLIIGAYQGTGYVLQNTYLGVRLSKMQEDEGYLGQTRMKLYREGFDMVKKYPITGVGLGNYGYHASKQTYAHSDVMEVWSTTGSIGLILYVSMYIMLWIRMNRLLRMNLDEEQRYTINFWKVLIVSFIILGIGRPNFSDYILMTFMGLIIGYVRYVEIEVRRRIAAKRFQYENRPQLSTAGVLSNA